MASIAGICNLALSHLGISDSIANLETERSREALACATLYEQTRDEALRDFPWPFATTVVDLALVAENPTSEWGYSYRYPSDCVNIRRLLSGITRVETRSTRVPYRVLADHTGQLIYTDQATAQAEYTFRADDPTTYPADFVQAFALLLAGYLAPRLTAGDPDKLGERALKLYQWRIATAQANALDEGQADDPPESDLIAARDGFIVQNLQVPRDL